MNEILGLNGDSLALDKIALMLGTSGDWNGADLLDSIADVINGSRPNVDLERDQFLAAFFEQRKYDPTGLRATVDYVAEPSDDVIGGAPW